MKNTQDAEIKLPKIIKNYISTDLMKFEKKNRFDTLRKNFDSTKISAPNLIFNKSKSKKITTLQNKKIQKISGIPINLPIYKKNLKRQQNCSFTKTKKNKKNSKKYNHYNFQDKSQNIKKAQKNQNSQKFKNQIRFDYSKKENTNPGFLYNNQEIPKTLIKTEKSSTFGFRRKNQNLQKAQICTPISIGPNSYFPKNNFDSTKKFSKGTTFGKSRREIFKGDKVFRNDSYCVYSSVGKQIESGDKHFRRVVFGRRERSGSVGYRGREERIRLRLAHACY